MFEYIYIYIYIYTYIYIYKCICLNIRNVSECLTHMNRTTYTHRYTILTGFVYITVRSFRFHWHRCVFAVVYGCLCVCVVHGIAGV